MIINNLNLYSIICILSMCSFMYFIHLILRKSYAKVIIINVLQTKETRTEKLCHLPKVKQWVNSIASDGISKLIYNYHIVSGLNARPKDTATMWNQWQSIHTKHK